MKTIRQIMIKGSLSFFLLLFGCRGITGQNINVEDLNDLIKSDSTIILIDVRNSSEFKGDMEKLAIARHIPLAEIDSSIQNYVSLKDKPIYFICRSGRRSKIAADKFLEYGLNGINVEGGMIAFRKKYPGEEK